MSHSPQKSWVDVNLPAITENYRILLGILPTRTHIVSVVKANGYGHGALKVAEALARTGCSFFGVATPEEGIELRMGKIPGNIIIMSSVEPQDIPDLLRHNLIPVIYQLDIARLLSAEVSRRRKKPSPIFIKIDTGMGRLGLLLTEIPSFIKGLRQLSPLRIEGIMTHLSDSLDPEYTRLQRSRFERAVRLFLDAGYHPPYTHSSNSGAILMHNTGKDNMVRPGLAIYGVCPDTRTFQTPSLVPALSWKTNIIHLKTVPAGYRIGYGKSFLNRKSRRIAILPVGYSDGYSRHLTNRAAVLIRGKRAPLLGSVCMDLTMVDVSNIRSVQKGDEVVLLGSQKQERITAEELADRAGTIPYDILTSISDRIPRNYGPFPTQSQYTR